MAGEIYLNNKDVANKVNGSTLTQRTEGMPGTYHLAQNPQYYEPSRSNNFMFYISGLTELLKDDIIHGYAKEHSEEVLKLSVNSSFVPHFTMNAIEIKRGNNTMKFAGTPTYSNGQLKVDDFIGAGTKDVLLAWQNRAYNVRTEKVGLASDYKIDGNLVEYTPDWQVVRTWKICGCWISGISEDDFGHESNDKRQITATVEYDKAYLDTSDLL